MKTSSAILALCGLASAIPMPELQSREVPQEHSHNKFLQLVRDALASNNPDNIGDPVFGLLGNAAAADGAGDITDLDCLQQATADQAFTNAKAAGNVTQMVGALVYRAIERNTAGVGTASVICTQTPVNAEIAALSQHQDPASDGAAATNKKITLALAKQIASVGGDPQVALQSGTFTPGSTDDSTGAGNTCDTEDDTEGCIFTQNLLVEDATAAEISSAVEGISASSSSNVTRRAALDFGSCTNPSIVFGAGFDGRTEESFEPADTTTFNHGSADGVGIIAGFICGQLGSSCSAGADAVAACSTASAAAVAATGQAAADAFNSALGLSSNAAAVTPAAAATSAAATSAAVASATAAASASTAAGTNVQAFTGTLGGSAPAVIDAGTGDKPFSTDGSTFVNKAAALQRSCSVQNNACSNAANSGSISSSVSDCNAQQQECEALATN